MHDDVLNTYSTDVGVVFLSSLLNKDHSASVTRTTDNDVCIVVSCPDNDVCIMCPDNVCIMCPDNDVRIIPIY